MNFLEGTLVFEEQYFLKIEGEDCRFALGKEIPKGVTNYINKNILIGIRPEDIIIQKNKLGNCSLQVVAYENMGNEQLVYLSVSNHNLIIRRPPANNVEIGSKIEIDFVKNKILFMGENGEVI